MSNKTAIVLVVDGLSAQHVGVYGNTWIDTPNISRLATCADVWEFAYTPTTHPSKSLESLIRGQHPLHFPTSESASNDVVESLHHRGIETFIISDANTDDGSGSAFAFQHWLQSPKSGVLADTIDQTQFAHSFAQLIELLKSDLPDRGRSLVWVQLKGFSEIWDAPYALRQEFAHDEDPDPPAFVEPPQFDLRQQADVDPDLILGIQQAYAAQLQVFDDCLGVFLDELDVENNPQTLIGLTSNRGYPLGEHLLVGQKPEISFGEAAHVPLIIRRGEYPVSTFRHQPLCYSSDLLSHVAAWFGESATDKIAERPGLAILANELVSIRTPAWYLVRSEHEMQLFVKPDDRWEVNDVASRCQSIIESIMENEGKIISMANSDFPAAGQAMTELPDELTATMRR